MANDYYDVLGVSRDATPRAIKEAFRRLTLQTHPDRSNAPDAEERYRRVTEAYGVLSDPDKRARYDARGHAGVADLSAEDLVGGIDLADLFGFSGLGGSVFERFFAGARAPRGADVELRIEVPLERIAHGGAEEVTLEHPRACAACAGSGASPTAPRRPCPMCDGAGTVLQTRRRGAMLFQQPVTCPACSGRGQRIDEPCPSCEGRGRVEMPQTLSLEIQPGVEDGAVFELAGLGMPSTQPGGRPGDLYIVVHAAPDPRFERRGANLRRTEAVEAPALVLGTKLEIPTLDGRVLVAVPPRTAPKSVLRIAGKGLPRPRTGGRGDLEVVLQLQLPASLTPEEVQLYTRLRQLAAQRTTGAPVVDLAEREDEETPRRWWQKKRWWWPFGRYSS